MNKFFCQRIKKQSLLYAKNEFIQIHHANKSIFVSFTKYAAANIGFFIIKNVKKIVRWNKPSVKVEIPKDVVVLYQFPRKVQPSLSPFALKLETWLRIADTKYINDFKGKLSPRTKLIPWISLNNFTVDDSQFSIEYLSKVFNKDMNSHLSEEQKAIARCIQKLNDESLRWCLALHRFWYSENRKETNLPRLAYWFLSFRIYLGAYAQGYGRMNKDDFYRTGKNDLKALNELLGSQTYFFNNEKPSDVDCSVFGMCAQFIYRDLGPFHHFITTECPNLVRFVHHMKETYWKDWDNKNNTLKYYTV